LTDIHVHFAKLFSLLQQQTLALYYSPGTSAGITYSAADLLRKGSRSAAVQAEIICYDHQGY